MAACLMFSRRRKHAAQVTVFFSDFMGGSLATVKRILFWYLMICIMAGMTGVALGIVSEL